MFQIYISYSPTSELVCSFTLLPIAMFVYSSQFSIVREGTVSGLIAKVSVASSPLLSKTLSSKIVCSVKVNSIESPDKLCSFIVQKNSNSSSSLSNVMLPSIIII